jgi:hypothetical protein
MSTAKATHKELRTFGLTMFCALAVLGGVLVWRGRTAGFVLWGIGLAFVLVALVRPGMLASLYAYWMKLALVMGIVMSHVILAVLYYVVVTPTGLVMRALGKRPLTLKPETGLESYWVPKKGGQPRERYEKMF